MNSIILGVQIKYLISDIDFDNSCPYIRNGINHMEYIAMFDNLGDTS